MNQQVPPLSHPSDGDWMQWLYDEADSDLQTCCIEHLKICPECRAKVEGWQLSLNALSQWNQTVNRSPLPTLTASPALVAAPPRQSQSEPAGARELSAGLIKYLVAACIVVLAFTTGKGLGSKPDLNQLRTDIKAELRDELLREVSTSLKSELNQLKNQDPNLVPLIQTESGRIVSATLANWAQQNSRNDKELETLLTGILQNQVTLRQDLETLAIQAEAQILRTRRELLRLAMTNESGTDLNEPPSTDPTVPGPQEFPLNQPLNPEF